MAHFLSGKYKAYYKAGELACVRDVFRFRALKETSLQLEVSRRDMESWVGRFLRYENAFITLIPVDEAQPRLGGKVSVKCFQMDWSTFTPSIKNYYGIYSEDFLTFGEFRKDLGDPLANEELLLKIMDDKDHKIVIDKKHFRADQDGLSFKREINEEEFDLDLESQVEEVKLTPMLYQTWSEVLFYGLGNKTV
mmetsp:Transcript_42780/g.31259  ORF Transcript_42780/g.31259 Transcript_42780/m.31259 type:complete len:193 (+) Transcript_42780:40-618(+)